MCLITGICVFCIKTSWFTAVCLDVCPLQHDVFVHTVVPCKVTIYSSRPTVLKDNLEVFTLYLSN